MTERDEVLAVSTAVAAVAARLGKMFGQNVQRPAACELDSGEFYRDLMFGFRLVRAARHERDDVFLATDQAAIGDRAAGHVAG